MAVPQLRERALFNQDIDGKWGIKDEKGEEMDKQLILSSSLSNKAAASQPPIPKVKKIQDKKGIYQSIKLFLLSIIALYSFAF